MPSPIDRNTLPSSLADFADMQVDRCADLRGNGLHPPDSWRVFLSLRYNNIMDHKFRSAPVARNYIATELIRNCLAKYEIPDCELYINTFDIFSDADPCFGYYTNNYSKNRFAFPIPAFSSTRFLEGCEERTANLDGSYTVKKNSSFLESHARLDFHKRKDKILFRGNTRQPLRMPIRLLKKFSKFKDFLDIDTVVKFPLKNVSDIDAWRARHNYIPFYEYCNYKFLLTVGGYGPWRLCMPHMFKTGSVIIKIHHDRPGRSGSLFFEPLLKDGFNYINLNYKTPDEIPDKIDSIIRDFKDNPSKYEDIAKNGLEVGSILTEELSINYTSYLLTQYAKKQSS